MESVCSNGVSGKSSHRDLKIIIEVVSDDDVLLTMLVRLESEVFGVDNKVVKELKNEFKIAGMAKANEWNECGDDTKGWRWGSKSSLIKGVRVSENIGLVPLVSNNHYIITKSFILINIALETIMNHLRNAKKNYN